MVSKIIIIIRSFLLKVPPLKSQVNITLYYWIYYLFLKKFGIKYVTSDVDLFSGPKKEIFLRFLERKRRWKNLGQFLKTYVYEYKYTSHIFGFLSQKNPI